MYIFQTELPGGTLTRKCNLNGNLNDDKEAVK